MGSLRLRALVLAALSILGALALYWTLLVRLFEQEITERMFAELEGHLSQLVGVTELDEAGGILIRRELADPRFSAPFSGLYWQIALYAPDAPSGGASAPITSRSLWDEILRAPEVSAEFGQIVRHPLLAFQEDGVMAIERRIVLVGAQVETPIRLLVARDRAELDEAKAAFDAEVARLVAWLALFLLLAALLQIQLGLSPLARLRGRLNAVRAGERAQLEGRFPLEVQQLVDELNALLRSRAESVADARARASDLAHGLKTPLAVLAAESRRLAEEGRTRAAEEIALQIDRMNRHVERELARARARGASGGAFEARTPLGPAIERLIGAFEKLPGSERLVWERAFDGALEVPMDPVDFEEVAGNLLDNARKWARGRVRVSARATADGVEVAIEEDGPGVPAAELEEIVARGRRLDQSAPGSGLGLAIAQEILNAYGGDLTLEASAALGGVRALIRAPARRE